MASDGLLEDIKQRVENGNNFVKLGAYSEAIEQYEQITQCLSDTPDLAFVFRAIAFCYGKLNQPSKAIRAATASLEQLGAGDQDESLGEIRMQCWEIRLSACLKLRDFFQATTDFVNLLMNAKFSISEPFPSISTTGNDALEIFWTKITMAAILNATDDVFKQLQSAFNTEIGNQPELADNKIESSLRLLQQMTISPKGEILNWDSIDLAGMSFWSVAHLIVILLSVATIPYCRRHLKLAHFDGIYDSLHVQPFKEYTSLFGSKLDTGAIIKRFEHIITNARGSLWQTADIYVTKEYPGRSIALVHDIGFYIARNYGNINTKFVDFNSIMKSVRVHMDDSVDYSLLQKIGSETSMTVETALQLISELLFVGVRMRTRDEEYANVLRTFPNLTTEQLIRTMKSLFDKEGKGVYDMYVIKLGLFDSQLRLMGPSGIILCTFGFQQSIDIFASNFGLSTLHPDVAGLLRRLKSAPKEVQQQLTTMSAESFDRH